MSCTRQAILNLPLAAYRKWAGPVEEGFRQAAKFLQMQKIFWRKDIPYVTQIVPLAAIITRLQDRWEQDGARQKISQWFWCGVFGELYGSAIETRFAKDVQEVPAWIADEMAVPTTVRESTFAQERLWTLRSRLAAAYKGIHALLMRSGCEDFRSGQPYELTSFWDERVDIHHIFPKAWCQKQQIERGRYDSVVNKTPISARANRIIGGAAPSVYLAKLRADAQISEERTRHILQSHLIDMHAMLSDNFEQFCERREEALIGLIEAATGKKVARVATQDEAIGEFVENDFDLEDDGEESEAA